MALIKCGECGKQFSTDAKACPHCGGKAPYKPGAAFILVVGLLIVFGISASIESSQPPPEAAPKTAEQIAQDQAQERRHLVVLITAKKLKDSMREPDSVEWLYMGTDEKAEVVCLRYRARNGFGGMAVETMTITTKEAGQEAELWNRHCIRDGLYDMLYVRNAI
jgi:Na+-transporting methylmalonyl-CoA/oxaloacetate decarboxylase gamma subunit